MSKQLAISSAFAIFAMAAMALTFTPNHVRSEAGESFALLQAGLAPDLPQLPFLN